MIITLTSNGETLSDNVDSRFGRAKHFIVYNTEDASFKAYNNKQNLSASQGAGIQSAQNVVEYGTEVLISGNCGPKAFKVLETANIKIYSASNCSVKEAIDSYLNNKLMLMTSANVEGHWS